MNSSNRPAAGKLVLPTVETCKYRHRLDDNGMAACGLLQQISGVADIARCQVSEDVCHACCRSFPPSAQRWNPVIASLIHELASQVAANGGLAGCSASSAQALKASAEQTLDVVGAKGDSLIPLRADRPCIHLGERQSDQSSAPGIEVFQCTHPAHATTTLDGCLRCRDWSAANRVSRALRLAEIVPRPPYRCGTRVRRWSVGVVTAPRREPTLEWCLDSLARAGWESWRLFVDGLMRIPDRHAALPITWRERPGGAWPNYFLALSEMVQTDPEADAYLLLQDDAVLYDGDNLREYLELILWPGERLGLASLYCPQPYTVFEPGWRPLPGPWVWGALAFAFPRQLAREFLGDPSVISHRWTSPLDGRSQVDVLIGEWADRHRHPIHYPCPSLVQHVGNTSSIWDQATNRGWRRADWFAGDLESPFARGGDLADFPEDLFPCRREFQGDYRSRVETGRKRMAERRAVICGLCRNVRHFLPRFAARVERLGRQFRDYQVVLYENDSTDATVEFLEDWRRKNDRVHVLSERLGRIRYPSIRSRQRVARLAEYRNRCRQYALARFADFEHFLMIDSDLPGGWSYDGLANTFGHDDWDFVGSSGLIQRHFENGSTWLQYDAWAFRALGHPSAHSNLEVNSTVFERGEPLLPVLSCFGGLAVYRMEAVEAAEYGGSDTEHAVFHERMRRQGFNRQYLNPSQIVLYSPS